MIVVAQSLSYCGSRGPSPLHCPVCRQPAHAPTDASNGGDGGGVDGGDGGRDGGVGDGGGDGGGGDDGGGGGALSQQMHPRYDLQSPVFVPAKLK